jgi:hypothetical protein
MSPSPLQPATVLVIEHNPFLGYVSFLPGQARFDDPSGPWPAFPIVTRTADLLRPADHLNDTTLMSLMLIRACSGPSLRCREAALPARPWLRLGALLRRRSAVALLAYLTYVATVPSPHVADFVRRCLAGSLARRSRVVHWGPSRVRRRRCAALRAGAALPSRRA